MGTLPGTLRRHLALSSTQRSDFSTKNPLRLFIWRWFAQDTIKTPGASSLLARQSCHMSSFTIYVMVNSIRRLVFSYVRYYRSRTELSSGSEPGVNKAL